MSIPFFKSDEIFPSLHSGNTDLIAVEQHKQILATNCCKDFLLYEKFLVVDDHVTKCMDLCDLE